MRKNDLDLDDLGAWPSPADTRGISCHVLMILLVLMVAAGLVRAGVSLALTRRREVLAEPLMV